MTVISESTFNEQEFYENSKENKGRNVIWKCENLNTPHTNELLAELTENNISITDFLSIIKKDTSDMNFNLHADVY